MAASKIYTVSIAAASFPAGITSLGTAPDGFAWVLRSVAFGFPATGAATASIQMGSPAIYVVRLGPGATIPWAYWEGRIAVPAGAPLLVDRGNTSGGVAVTCYQLSTP